MEDKIFNNYKKLRGTDLVIYQTLTKHESGLSIRQIEEKLTDKETGRPAATTKTLRGGLKRLEKAGVLIVLTGSRKMGQPNIYQLKNGTKQNLVNDKMINEFIKRNISKNELKLYTLLSKEIKAGKGNELTLGHLGKLLGVTKPSVSEALTELKRKGYIETD